jgi:hypothetical protein
VAFNDKIDLQTISMALLFEGELLSGIKALPATSVKKLAEVGHERCDALLP